jgi:hypothetical protein
MKETRNEGERLRGNKKRRRTEIYEQQEKKEEREGRKLDENNTMVMKEEMLRVLTGFIWLRIGTNTHVPVNTVLKLLGL